MAGGPETKHTRIADYICLWHVGVNRFDGSSPFQGQVINRKFIIIETRR